MTRLGEWEAVRLVLEKDERSAHVFMYVCPGSYLRRDVTRLSLAGDQLLPGLGALADHVHGVARRKIKLSAPLFSWPASMQPSLTSCSCTRR